MGYDATVPEVVLALSGVTLVGDNTVDVAPLDVTAVWSESVTFVAGDVTTSAGTSVANFAMGGATSYTFELDPVADGSVSVSV